MTYDAEGVGSNRGAARPGLPSSRVRSCPRTRTPESADRYRAEGPGLATATMLQPGQETLDRRARDAIQRERLSALIERLQASASPYWREKLGGTGPGAHLRMPPFTTK